MALRNEDAYWCGQSHRNHPHGVTTPANVHDVTKADELRRPDGWEVIGDSGYLGMEKRDSADPERVTYTAAKRYSQRKKLSAERIADEKLLSSIR